MRSDPVVPVRDALLWECLIRVTAVSGTDAHGGRLVNNNDTLTVTEPVDLLRVRVMAGAEGVGMDPV